MKNNNQLAEKIDKDHEILERVIVSIAKIEAWMPSMEKTFDNGLKNVVNRLDITNGKVIKNTEFRIGIEANINLIKYSLGFIGISNIIALILLIFR